MFPYRAKDDSQLFTAQTEDSSVRFTFGLYEEKADTLAGCAMKAKYGTDTYWLDRRSNFKDRQIQPRRPDTDERVRQGPEKGV
jgi:hypothetical protein